MTTLRDRVREMLSAREPNDREAAGELDAILSRAHAKRRVRTWTLALAPVLVAAALLLYFLAFPSRERQVALGDRSTQPATQAAAKAAAQGPTRGVHLYLHVAGEPSDRAIALDLDSKGDL